jgi:PncC family amidohydrolase
MSTKSLASNPATLTALALPVANHLKTARQTVAVCESSVGGLIAAALVSIPNASVYFIGGTVVYTLAARRQLLDITDVDMTGLRGATEAYALLCAQRLRNKFGCTWALAETGATGPNGNPYGDPPGHACFAVSGPVEKSITVATGDNNREANMWAFAKSALEFFERCALGRA